MEQTEEQSGVQMMLELLRDPAQRLKFYQRHGIHGGHVNELLGELAENDATLKEAFLTGFAAAARGAHERLVDDVMENPENWEPLIKDAKRIKAVQTLLGIDLRPGKEPAADEPEMPPEIQMLVGILKQAGVKVQKVG